MQLTERQQVVMAKNLSAPESHHGASFADRDQVSAARPQAHGWVSHAVDTDSAMKDSEMDCSPSSASTTEREGDWNDASLPRSVVIARASSSGSTTNGKSTFKRRKAKFTAKSATLHVRRDQKLVREAASILLDISDRVPFSGVKSSGVKVWAKFDQETRSCSTSRELMRQARWFLGQIKEPIRSELWSSTEQEWMEAAKHCDKGANCKALVTQLETVAINWTAVARTWAAERGLDRAAWPASWGAGSEVHVQPGSTQQVEKWRACVEACLDGKVRQLGLTFVLAVPADIAAAGPQRHSEEETATSNGAQEWEGVREAGLWESRAWRQGNRLSSDSDGEEQEEVSEDLWDDEPCEMQPRSPFHARSPDGTQEPVGGGMLDGTGDMFVTSDALGHTCPGVIDDDHDQLVHGLWGWD